MYPAPCLTQLVNLPAAGDVDVPAVESWRPAVLANCCNEITTKFSVCCIIKKFEKLLPKPGNNQDASPSAELPPASGPPRPFSYGLTIINQRLCGGCSFCMIDSPKA